MPWITPSPFTGTKVGGMRRLKLKLVLIILIRIWYHSPLNILSFFVWKAGSYLEPRRVLLLIQTFIDEPVGLRLNMCLMFDYVSQIKTSLLCTSFAFSWLCSVWLPRALISSHFVPVLLIFKCSVSSWHCWDESVNICNYTSLTTAMSDHEPWVFYHENCDYGL